MKINYRRKTRERKKLRGSKTIDFSCKNNGSCSICKNNRLHYRNKIEEAADADISYYTSTQYITDCYSDYYD